MLHNNVCMADLFRQQQQNIIRTSCKNFSVSCPILPKYESSRQIVTEVPLVTFSQKSMHWEQRW